MKILAFAATNSRTSINKQLLQYAGSLLADVEFELIDLNDYELPLFSVDKEQELGQPELAQTFYQKMGAADALIISFAEHNGSYTAAYKNLFDWTSRIDMKVFQNKPVVMLATSPGPGGAASVLAAAVNSAPYFAADVKANVSVPSFYDNFDMTAGKLTEPELVAQMTQALATLTSQ
ncbi:NADPH-dependent FMN reductase [Shewanella marina]|uniref:NADPH-dependent FMN reductase n=1 Tax=Shewanella marina TaxID=487319 RepID=UPI000470B39F|nr:NAD(P)H-dependent oxidoreductase [Shewanella marina]